MQAAGDLVWGEGLAAGVVGGGRGREGGGGAQLSPPPRGDPYEPQP